MKKFDRIARWRNLTFSAGACLCMTSAPADAADYLCKNVGQSWEWFGDHVALWIDYVVVGTPGRRYEVGTGVSINGSPWGSRDEYSGPAEFSAYGAGALHIRQADQGEPFKVCATSTGLKPITIIDAEF
jgi:hypothetical protein